MSAFHAFRTRVETLKSQGHYTFLPKEKPTDLLTAPFAFEEALKPTTFIPLALLGILAAVDLKGQGIFNFGDAAFTAGVSYNAGVGEEALFRGYMMPVLYEWWDHRFLANSAQALVFGAAHLSPSNPAPVFQALGGYYLGWLTHRRNGWTLKQAIFLHTWWDVIAIGYAIAKDKGQARMPRTIPLLNASF